MKRVLFLALVVVPVVSLVAGCSDAERVRDILRDNQSGAEESASASVQEENLAVDSDAQIVVTQPEEGRAGVAALSAPDVYVVSSGDTLFAIARRFGLPIRAIIARNGLTPPYHLRVGQEISLPRQRVHEVQRGDTLYGISRLYASDRASIAALNDLKPPYGINIGQRLLIPTPEGLTYSSASASAVADLTPSAIQVEEIPQDQAFDPAAQPVFTPPKKEEEEKVEVEEEKEEEKTPRATAAALTKAPEDQGEAQEESKPAPRLDKVPPRSGPGFLWPLAEAGEPSLLKRFGPQPGGRHNDGINLAAKGGADILAAENGVVAYVGDDLRGFGDLLLLKHENGWVTAYAHAETFTVAVGDTVNRGDAIGQVGKSGAVDSPQLHFELRRGTQAIDPLTLLQR